MEYKKKENFQYELKLGFHCARQYMNTYFWSIKCILMTNHKAAYTHDS